MTDNELDRYGDALKDDGAAFRLAVELGINIQFSGNRYSISYRTVFDVCCEWEGNDRMELIRRQIVEIAILLSDDKRIVDEGIR